MIAAALLILAAPLALAKTDLVGCSTTTIGGSLTYFVPGTGEICAFLDCGGGRAPPATNVPGCPLYKGTDTYCPLYLAGFGPNGVHPPTVAPVPVPPPVVVSSGAAPAPAPAAPSAPIAPVKPVSPAPAITSPTVPLVTAVSTITPVNKINGTYTSGPLSQSTNAAGNVAAPLVGGLLLGAAALVL